MTADERREVLRQHLLGNDLDESLLAIAEAAWLDEERQWRK